MSKLLQAAAAAAAAAAGGERPPSRGRAPPSRAGRHPSASAQPQRESPPSRPGSSTARPKRGDTRDNYVTFQEPPRTGAEEEAPWHHHHPGEVQQQQQQYPPGHGEDAAAGRVPPRGQPKYVPPSQQRRREQPPPPAAAAGPMPPGSRFISTKTIERVSTIQPDDNNGARRGGARFGSTKTIERVSTLLPEDGRSPPLPPQHYSPTTTQPHFPQGQQQHHQQPHYSPPTGQHQNQQHGKSPLILPPRRGKRRPAEYIFTFCCIFFWLLVIGIGGAVLAIYLIYHPQPPKLRVNDATLNAGYIDELRTRTGHQTLTLNADVSVLASFYNPNTKIDIVLRYMQLDLYFEGNLVGTQAVWPAPMRQAPKGFVLRSVHIDVSEVRLSRGDALSWKNATLKGGPVALQLAGRLRTEMDFGKWLPFRYWIYPRCSLWFDPPPSGALLRARC